MGALSIWHILIFAGIAILLFGGGGKISDLMGDVARGITAFRAGLIEAESAPVSSRAIASRRRADEAPDRRTPSGTAHE